MPSLSHARNKGVVAPVNNLQPKIGLLHELEVANLTPHPDLQELHIYETEQKSLELSGQFIAKLKQGNNHLLVFLTLYSDSQLIMSAAIHPGLEGSSDVSSSDADGERNGIAAPPTPESERTKSELEAHCDKCQSTPVDNDLKHILETLADGQKELLARKKR